MKDLILIATVLFLAFAIKNSDAQQLSPGFNSRSFQYLNGVLSPAQPTTTAVANAFNAEGLPKWYSVSITGTATPVQVVLERSLDNSNWSTVVITNSYVGVASNTLPAPALYFRMRATGIPVNSQVTATAVGTW